MKKETGMSDKHLQNSIVRVMQNNAEQIRWQQPKLTAEEWDTIAGAVQDKLAAVRSKFYGWDRECKDWAEHLSDILEELSGRSKATPEFSRNDWIEIYYAVESDDELAEKLGPDAENMYCEED